MTLKETESQCHRQTATGGHGDGVAFIIDVAEPRDVQGGSATHGDLMVLSKVWFGISGSFPYWAP